jgi:hypothetical protein
MTRAEYHKRLEELEREADRRGCCVIPAKPLTPPTAGAPSLRKPAAGRAALRRGRSRKS